MSNIMSFSVYFRFTTTLVSSTTFFNIPSTYLNKTLTSDFMTIGQDLIVTKLFITRCVPLLPLSFLVSLGLQR